MLEHKKYNITKPQKLKTMSIKTWCEINDKKDILELWDYDLNKYGPEVVSWASKYDIYFKCENGIHKSHSIKLYSVTSNGTSVLCKECYLEQNSFGKWCEENAIEILNLWDYDLNDCSPYEVHRCTHKKYYFKCPRGIHESSLHELAHITSRDYKIYCKYCNSFAQYLLDSFGNNALTLMWDVDKNVISPYDISHSASRTKVWIHCLKDPLHESYLISPDNFVKGRRCPVCKKESQNSILEEKVIDYLKNTYNYKLLHEYQCTVVCRNPENGYVLPYDNQLVIGNCNLFIEVNGIQHYKITGYTKTEAKRHNITSEEALLRRQKLDKYKEDYIHSLCGCYFLVIPYWTEQDESYKTLIDNKIQEILNNTKLMCAQ